MMFSMLSPPREAPPVENLAPAALLTARDCTELEKPLKCREIGDPETNRMALIQCPDCGVDVSDRAAACPKCACPIAEIGTRSRGVPR